VRELMLGMVAVGLVAGVAVGRASERSRRAGKDFSAAQAAVPKAQKIMAAERRKAALMLVTVGAFMLILFLSAIKMPH
jgi:hypothetical protein